MPLHRCTPINRGNLTPGISVAPGGTVTVLLGTTIIGRGNLTSDVPTGRRRLLALTSLFTIPITVPAGTPAGSQVSKPCLHLTLHEEFQHVIARLRLLAWPDSSIQIASRLLSMALFSMRSV